jgi:ABC-type dipeptide/oligopeptide/nickel transport system permease component
MGPRSTHRTLLVLVAVLLGVIAALVVGILTAVGGAHVTASVLSGGAAFVAVVPLALLVQKELGLFTDR